MTLTASETSRWRFVVPTFLSSDDVKPGGGGRETLKNPGKVEDEMGFSRHEQSISLTIGVVHLGAEIRTHKKVWQTCSQV